MLFTFVYILYDRKNGTRLSVTQFSAFENIDYKIQQHRPQKQRKKNFVVMTIAVLALVNTHNEK